MANIVRAIRKVPHSDYDYIVYITRQQHSKLPDWVRERVTFYNPWDDEFTSKRWVYTYITAKDELQAMMRFNQLWAGLPKEGSV